MQGCIVDEFVSGSREEDIQFTGSQSDFGWSIVSQWSSLGITSRPPACQDASNYKPETREGRTSAIMRRYNMRMQKLGGWLLLAMAWGWFGAFKTGTIWLSWVFVSVIVVIGLFFVFRLMFNQDENA